MLLLADDLAFVLMSGDAPTAMDVTRDVFLLLLRAPRMPAASEPQIERIARMESASALRGEAYALPLLHWGARTGVRLERVVGGADCHD